MKPIVNVTLNNSRKHVVISLFRITLRRRCERRNITVNLHNNCERSKRCRHQRTPTLTFKGQQHGQNDPKGLKAIPSLRSLLSRGGKSKDHSKKLLTFKSYTEQMKAGRRKGNGKEWKRKKKRRKLMEKQTKRT